MRQNGRRRIALAGGISNSGAARQVKIDHGRKTVFFPRDPDNTAVLFLAGVPVFKWATEMFYYKWFCIRNTRTSFTNFELFDQTWKPENSPKSNLCEFFQKILKQHFQPIYDSESFFLNL